MKLWVQNKWFADVVAECVGKFTFKYNCFQILIFALFIYLIYNGNNTIVNWIIESYIILDLMFKDFFKKLTTRKLLTLRKTTKFIKFLENLSETLSIKFLLEYSSVLSF